VDLSVDDAEEVLEERAGKSKIKFPTLCRVKGNR
jgi:hypothetical protein